MDDASPVGPRTTETNKTSNIMVGAVKESTVPRDWT